MIFTARQLQEKSQEQNVDLYMHCGESKTQRKWFLDEKRDGFVDENRINNQQNENQQKVYTPKNLVLSI